MKAKELAYWINEREAMRMKRERGDAAPWSADPAMAGVRYCNVRREDDKVTKWIAEHWRHVGPWSTLSMTMARMVNWIPTLSRFRRPQIASQLMSAERWVRECWKIMLAVEGHKWGNAYTISTCGRKMGKEDYVFGHVLAQVAQRHFDAGWEFFLADAHTALMTVDGLGSFLAAQVLADLKNTRGHDLAYALDWWDWSAHGPGSLRGLEAYFGHKMPPRLYQRAITQCWAEVQPLLQPYVGRLHMQDFQNCLCEFSKYQRFLDGGAVRNTYRAV